MALLERLIAAGLPPERMLVGVGLNNLPDTLELARHARERGCGGVLVLPPFYVKGVDDDGLYRYFAALFERGRRLKQRLAERFDFRLDWR